jgi:hypothetical protein
MESIANTSSTMKELTRLESEYSRTKGDGDEFVFAAVKIADEQVAAINANFKKYKSDYLESRVGDDNAFYAIVEMSKKLA